VRNGKRIQIHARIADFIRIVLVGHIGRATQGGKPADAKFQILEERLP